MWDLIYIPNLVMYQFAMAFVIDYQTAHRA